MEQPANPTPSPEQSNQEPKPQPDTALDVRNRYGMRAAIFLGLMIWFGYDGWFNPEIHSKNFNKIGAVLLCIGFIFCAVMAGSAALTVQRQAKEKAQQPPESPKAS